MRELAIVVAIGITSACGGGGSAEPADAAPLPAPACAPAATPLPAVPAPVLAYTLYDRWQEGWLASPAVVDLDGVAPPEIVVPRHELLLVWNATNPEPIWRASLPGRIWASPVAVDLVAGSPGLEVAVASRGELAVYSASGQLLPGFPLTWQDELRTLAAGNVDGDPATELVAVTTTPLEGNGQRDIVIAVNPDGSIVPGFPANTSGAAGCDDACYVTGGYDQNLALGDVDGDAALEIFATQDNAYLSLHDGDGRAFDAAPIFDGRTKFSGIRWMVDYDLAQQGYADDEAVDEQAHFTNSAPAIADLDGDGTGELIVLGSVQNAAQTDRERGVGLWVARPDGTRPADWIAPPRFSGYRGGLWDAGDNIVAITNQVAVADLDPGRAGPEIVFAGFDGELHVVDARAQPVWSRPYTTSDSEWTGGVAIADLSGDGVAELVLATYGPSGGDLIIFDAGGNQLHRVPLGGRGAMAVPTIADADSDGDLDITVSLKDGEDRVRQVVIYDVPGSTPSCLPWPTGRGNDRRDGYVPPS